MRAWFDAVVGYRAVVATTLTAAPSARARHAAAFAWPLVPAALAAALALVAIGMRWRGSDLPAHFFRVALVERDGFEIWNNQWFGGHHTLGYGALLPVFGAAFGIWPVAVVSAAASALLADILITRGLGHRWGWPPSWWSGSTRRSPRSTSRA